MTTYKDLGLIILLIIDSMIISCYAIRLNSCTSQHLTVSDGGMQYLVTWKSKSDSDNSVVLSNPPCYDQKGNLVVRLCSNGVWITVKNSRCHSIEKNMLCPLGFTQEDKICILVTEPQTWERQCPYNGASETMRTNYNSVWLPVKRIIQYGAFEYILPGDRYGLEYFEEDSSESLEEALNTNMDCVVKQANGIEFSACNSVNSHVCLYAHDEFLYYCPIGCVPGGLGSNYCFCKVHYESDQFVPADKVCGKLAVPKYSYERSILLKLVGSDTCLVEDVQENSLFTSLNFENPLYLAIHKNEWGLYRSRYINCAVCKVNAMLYPKVDLKLKFNSKSNKLHLHIYSPEGLFKIHNHEGVYCFTDATGRLRTRVEVEEVWDSRSKSQTGRKLQVFKVSIVRNEPGNYWCEVFQLPDVVLIKSNTVVAYKKLKGHEYSVRLQIHNFCRFSLVQCKMPSITFINILSKVLFRDRFFSRFVRTVRLFHIYNIDKRTDTLDILLHLTTENKLPFIAEYYLLKNNLNRLKFKNTTIVFFRSSLLCVPEITASENLTLHWNYAAIGKITIPDEFCVQETGVPVRRKCKGDFVFGSDWTKVEGTCAQNATISSKTQYLRSLLYSSLSMILPKNISDVIENSTDLTVLDLYYLAAALAKVSSLSVNNSKEFISEVSQIVDDLIIVNSTILKESQILLNSTDEILDSFECKLLAVNTSEDILLMKKNNVVVQVSKPFINNISGLALYGEEGVPFAQFRISHLYTNTSFNDLISDENLEVAVYVPQNLLKIISENMSLDMQTDLVVIITIYYTDTLFNNDINDDDAVVSRVVSVSIPGYGEFLQTPIPVILKPRYKNNMRRKLKCAFWNYGLTSETGSGYWSTLGGDYLGTLDNTSLEICSFSHLTNFGLLVRSGDYVKEDNNSQTYNSSMGKYHDKVLTIISDIGCIFSIFGITGIFITSLVFHSWREKVGTRILNQLCIAILLQIIFLNIATVGVSEVEISQGFCKVVGIVLHYVTISEFSWMLVAAVLQFFRFVKVIGPMPNRIILKAMLVGWGMPVVPVILICAVNIQSYSAGIQGICFPKGINMYIGVLLPIGLIVSANLAVFITVIRNVFVLSIESRGNSQNVLKRQICLAVLLFFLLGLPWIFGLLSEIISHNSPFSYIFLYLFCLTATLQGFVLFIFYVVLDKSTRTLWLILFKNIFNKKLY